MKTRTTCLRRVGADRAGSERLRHESHQPYDKDNWYDPEDERSWATVNTADPAEMAEFRIEQERLASERARAAFERLKLLGIIDENGESTGGELPPDMRPGAQRDFGG